MLGHSGRSLPAVLFPFLNPRSSVPSPRARGLPGVPPSLLIQLPVPQPWPSCGLLQTAGQSSLLQREISTVQGPAGESPFASAKGKLPGASLLGQYPKQGSPSSCPCPSAPAPAGCPALSAGILPAPVIASSCPGLTEKDCELQRGWGDGLSLPCRAAVEVGQAFAIPALVDRAASPHLQVPIC